MNAPVCDICGSPAKITAMCKDGPHNLCETHVCAFACPHFVYIAKDIANCKKDGRPCAPTEECIAEIGDDAEGVR